jgi:hypothetical protein
VHKPSSYSTSRSLKWNDDNFYVKLTVLEEFKLRLAQHCVGFFTQRRALAMRRKYLYQPSSKEIWIEFYDKRLKYLNCIIKILTKILRLS